MAPTEVEPVVYVPRSFGGTLILQDPGEEDRSTITLTASRGTITMSGIGDAENGD